MKKNNYDGRGAEECTKLDWVQLSVELDKNEAGQMSDNIVGETISQIASEDLKVDTSYMDGVKAAVDSFYAYENKKSKSRGSYPEMDSEEAIRRSVDEKIIIRSEELKHKRRSSEMTRAEKMAALKAKSRTKKDEPPKKQESKTSDDSFRHAKGLDKYRRLGILPTKKNGPSDFRKKSADWRYDNVPEAQITDEAIEQAESEETFFDRLRSMSYVQWLSVAMAVVILVTSVMTTTVYADYRGEQNKALAMARLPYFEDDASMIAYSETDNVMTDDVVMEDAAEAPDAAEGKMLSLILTSVEKDLKVKLVDDQDTLVKGVRWGISVTDDKDKESDYEDEDEDGIIHLTGINAGDYSVAIKDSDALSGYVFPTVGQKVSVKAKVEYKVIANIKDEIKKESEVNAAAEDNGNKAADVETGTAPKDTVEFVESSKTESGETYEESSVDLSKTEVIASAGGRLYAALSKIADAVRTSTGDTLASIRLAQPARTVAMENNEDTSAQQGSTDQQQSSTDQQQGSTDQQQGSTDQQQGSTDQQQGSTDQQQGSTDQQQSSTDQQQGSTDQQQSSGTSSSSTSSSSSSSSSSTMTTTTAAPTPTPTGTVYKDEAQLYDSAKNPLYVSDNGTYRLAKYADYRTGSFYKYYKKVVGYVYTGWQNIDGRSYYFTKDHEKVTGDQVIGGVTYSFNSDGSLNVGSGTLGIDVSKYQPSINWSSVKASGVDFVIIRCGYRGASTGALIEDPYFKSHIKGAKNAGLKVGVYYFSTALNEAEAVEEASAAAALCSGYGISYPVFLDVESSSRPGYNTLSPAQRTANIQAFCKTIASAGYTPGLYANKTWLTEKINTSSLSCKIWLAQYNANGPTYSGRYDIWQYTSKGRVDGISGNVDMNKSFLRY